MAIWYCIKQPLDLCRHDQCLTFIVLLCNESTEINVWKVVVRCYQMAPASATDLANVLKSLSSMQSPAAIDQQEFDQHVMPMVRLRYEPVNPTTPYMPHLLGDIRPTCNHRIVSCIRYWLREQPSDFRGNSELVDIIHEILSQFTDMPDIDKVLQLLMVCCSNHPSPTTTTTTTTD
jgi:hypothetical protein